MTGIYETLRRIAAALDRESDPDVRDAVVGLNEFLDGGYRSLDDALGIRPHSGQRSVQTQALLSERNSLLCEAAATYYPNENTSNQSRELHRAISRYSASSWKRDRRSTTCPPRLDDTLQGFAWRILSVIDHPVSERRIRAILATSNGYSRPKTTSILKCMTGDSGN